MYSSFQYSTTNGIAKSQVNYIETEGTIGFPIGSVRHYYYIFFYNVLLFWFLTW